MADSIAFDFVCRTLEQESSLDRLESRGTVRLALKQAGLASRSVTPEEMVVVVERLLPGELRARGIDGGDATCESLVRALAELDVGSDVDETPDAVFRRLGR